MAPQTGSPSSSSFAARISYWAQQYRERHDKNSIPLNEKHLYGGGKKSNQVDWLSFYLSSIEN